MIELTLFLVSSRLLHLCYHRLFWLVERLVLHVLLNNHGTVAVRAAAYFAVQIFDTSLC